MAIRQLPPNLVNRIAAGEVVERPASVVKELIENAIDAGATRIDVVANGGGLGLIRVTDDGSGMDRDDLALAVERHATSKLQDDDLSTILTLGFRGEALPSIGAVGEAHHHEPRPRRRQKPMRSPSMAVARRRSSLPRIGGGTRIEVRDLFYATPARLKFMKSERAESGAIADIVKRLALAKPEIAFSLAHGERTILRLDPCPPGLLDHGLPRLGRILGEDFVTDALPVRAERGNIAVEGLRRTCHAAPPEQPRAISRGQWQAGTRQAARRRGARRLWRPRAERAAPDACAVPHASSRRGRRERAPGQDRAQIPRRASRARADRHRAA